MGCPAIFLTLINNLGTIGTWFSSPSHIIYPIPLPPLSFGSLRSLVSFRTRRAWEWLVFARLACFSWKQKDLLEKQCYFCLSISTVKNCVFLILVAQSVSVVAQYVLSPVCNKFIIHLKFSTFYSIFSLMRCLRDFKTALTRVYYFTVGREASFASQLFIFWMKRFIY